VDIGDTAGRKARVANNVAALLGVFTGPWSREPCANMVCEATGGYERPLMEAAGALGLPLRRIHPNRARAFAKARAARQDRRDRRGDLGRLRGVEAFFAKLPPSFISASGGEPRLKDRPAARLGDLKSHYPPPVVIQTGAEAQGRLKTGVEGWRGGVVR